MTQAVRPPKPQIFIWLFTENISQPLVLDQSLRALLTIKTRFSIVVQYTHAWRTVVLNPDRHRITRLCPRPMEPGYLTAGPEHH